MKILLRPITCHGNDGCGGLAGVIKLVSGPWDIARRSATAQIPVFGSIKN